MCRIGSRVNFDFFFPLSCARKKRVVNDGKCNQPMYRDIYTGTPCVRLIFHVRYTILTACVDRTKPELYISVQWDPRAHLWLWLSFDFISRFFYFHRNIYGTFCWTKESFCCHQVVRSDVQSPHRLTTPNRINVLTVSLFRWGFLFMRLD